MIYDAFTCVRLCAHKFMSCKNILMITLRKNGGTFQYNNNKTHIPSKCYYRHVNVHIVTNKCLGLGCLFIEFIQRWMNGSALAIIHLRCIWHTTVKICSIKLIKNSKQNVYIKALTVISGAVLLNFRWC